ncbi:MAG: hypothetical protein ACRYFA_14760 [Janthinobacterium lividum]
MSTNTNEFNDPNKNFSDSTKIKASDVQLEQQFFRYELENFVKRKAPNVDYNILYEKALFFDTLVALVQGEFKSREAGITYRGQLDLAIEGLKAGSLKSFFVRSGANYNIEDFPIHVKGESYK